MDKNAIKSVYKAKFNPNSPDYKALGLEKEPDITSACDFTEKRVTAFFLRSAFAIFAACLSNFELLTT